MPQQQQQSAEEILGIGPQRQKSAEEILGITRQPTPTATPTPTPTPKQPPLPPRVLMPHERQKFNYQRPLSQEGISAAARGDIIRAEGALAESSRKIKLPSDWRTAKLPMIGAADETPKQGPPAFRQDRREVKPGATVKAGSLRPEGFDAARFERRILEAIADPANADRVPAGERRNMETAAANIVEREKRAQFSADTDRRIAERAREKAAAPSYPEQLVNRFARGIMGTAESAITGASLPHPDMAKDFRRFGVLQTPKEREKRLKEVFPVDPTDESFLSKSVEAVGSAYPFALGSAASGAAGLPAFLAPALMGAASNAGQTYDEALLAGKDEESAKRAAVVGALIGLTQGAGVGRIGGKAGAITGAARGGLRQLGKVAGKEAIEEEIQEDVNLILNDVNAKIISGYDPKRAIGESLKETFGLGAFVGGTFSGGVGLAAIERREIAKQVAGVTQPLPAAPGAQPQVTQPPPRVPQRAQVRLLDDPTYRTADLAPYRERVVAIARNEGKLTPNIVQRRMGIGYGRALALVETLKREGVLGTAGEFVSDSPAIPPQPPPTAPLPQTAAAQPTAPLPPAQPLSEREKLLALLAPKAAKTEAKGVTVYQSGETPATPGKGRALASFEDETGNEIFVEHPSNVSRRAAVAIAKRQIAAQPQAQTAGPATPIARQPAAPQLTKAEQEVQRRFRNAQAGQQDARTRREDADAARGIGDLAGARKAYREELALLKDALALVPRTEVGWRDDLRRAIFEAEKDLRDINETFKQQRKQGAPVQQAEEAPTAGISTPLFGKGRRQAAETSQLPVEAVQLAGAIPETAPLAEMPPATVIAETAPIREAIPATSEPTIRITEGEGAELPSRVSRAFEGQPTEIPRMSPEEKQRLTIEARREEREAVYKGAFGKFGEAARKTNVERSRPALAEHPELRELLNLPEMPPYLGEGGNVNPAWNEAAQDTLNALAELGQVPRSSELFVEPKPKDKTAPGSTAEGGLRGAYKRLLIAAERKGRKIGEGLKQTFRETAATAMKAQESVERFLANDRIHNVLRTLENAASEGRQLNRKEQAQLKAGVISVAKETGLTKHFADNWFKQAIDSTRRRAESRREQAREGDSKRGDRRDDEGVIPIEERATGTLGKPVSTQTPVRPGLAGIEKTAADYLANADRLEARSKRRGGQIVGDEELTTHQRADEILRDLFQKEKQEGELFGDYLRRLSGRTNLKPKSLPFIEDFPRMQAIQRDIAEKKAETAPAQTGEERKGGGQYLGAGLGSLQAFFDKPKKPKTTPLRQIADALGHGALKIDPVAIEKETKAALIEALKRGKAGSLPFARATYWAEKLGAKKLAGSLGQRQQKFVLETLEVVQGIADASDAMDKAKRGSATWTKARKQLDRARIQLSNRLSKVVEYTTPAQYAGKAYKASLLSAPHIPFFNVLHQVSQFPLHEAQKAMEFLLPPESVLKKWGVSYDKAPVDIRTWAPAMARETKAIASGAGSSFGDIKDMLRYGVTKTGLAGELASGLKAGETGGTDKYELGHRPKLLPGLDQVIMMIGRFQGAADVPFYNMVFAASLAAEADATARKMARDNPSLKLTKDDIKALARDLAHEPSPAMVIAATDEANRFKLDYPTFGYRMLQVLRNVKAEKMAGRHVDAVYKAAFDFVIPFSKIPLAAVDTALFRYSPVGAARVASRLAMSRIKKAKGKEFKGRYKDAAAFGRDTAELYRQSIVGTVAWLALYGLGSLGYIAFTGGADDEERADIRAIGEARGEKYNPEIIIGDTAFDVGKFGPVGQAAAVGAKIMAAKKPRYIKDTQEAESDLTRYDRALTAAGRAVVMGNPLGRGVEDIAEAFDAKSVGKGLGKFVVGKGRAIVPGLVRDVAKIAAPVKTIPDDTNGIGRFRADLASGVPSQRRKMQPRLDVLGREIAEPHPFSFSRDVRRDPQLEELRDLDVGLTKPQREKGESATDFNLRMRERGETYRKTLGRLGESEAMRDTDADTRRAIYEKSLDATQMKRAEKLSPQSVERELGIEGLRGKAYAALRVMPEYQRLKEADRKAVRSLINEELNRFRAEAASLSKQGRFTKEKVATIPEWEPEDLAKAALEARQ